MSTIPGRSVVDREADYGAAATRQKTRWYQTILRVAAGFPSVAANGNHNDAGTRQALRQFQRFYRLQETGYLQVDSNLALTQRALEWIYRVTLPNRKGIAGPELSEKIRQFQRDYGLGVDGKVGAQTREAMIKVLDAEIPSPLRRYHRTLGPEVKTAAPAATNTCALVSQGGCWVAADTRLPSGVIGADGRTRITHRQSLEAPWRWVCLIFARFDDPDGGAPIFQRGTGTLITAQHVLTAAHVVFDEIDGSQGTRRKSEAQEIIVVPACRGLIPAAAQSIYPTIPHTNGKLVAPFGYFRAAGNPLFHTPIDWIVSLDHRSDYAVVRLDRAAGFVPVPGQTGKRLGWWGSSAHGHGSVIQPDSKEQLLQKTVNVAGYPHCDPQTTETYRQFVGNGALTEIALGDAAGGADVWIGHGVDARTGQSGGPIWTLSRNGTRSLTGVQILAGRLASTGNCLNFGLHLAPDIWSEIQGWVA